MTIYESSRTKCPVHALKTCAWYVFMGIYYHVLKYTLWLQLSLPSLAKIQTRDTSSSSLNHMMNKTAPLLPRFYRNWMFSAFLNCILVMVQVCMTKFKIGKTGVCVRLNGLFMTCGASCDFFFCQYPRFSGIAPCVGTAGTVHDTYTWRGLA